MIKRAAGVLLHITSLPGKYGYGTLGSDAYRFINLISSMGFSYWEVLPLNIPDDVDCPYSSASSYFPNPMIIDLEHLYSLGLITKNELKSQEMEISNEQLSLNYKKIWESRLKLLENASLRCNDIFKLKVKRFVKKNKEIEEACKYFALTDKHNIFSYQFVAYIFDLEWKMLIDYAHKMNVSIIGDVPIYVDLNSSDVYFNKDIFDIEDGKPKFVSGVPGDENFDGQKWGHPLYNIDKLKETDYEFLLHRFKYFIDKYDLIRIDHFKAFSSFYAIPYDKGPEAGHFIKGVGEEFVSKLIKVIGKDKIIAEDVGGNDEDTQKLLNDFDIPGMDIYINYSKIDSYRTNRVVYTGTHDNNTLVGFLKKKGNSPEEALVKAKKIVSAVLNSKPSLAIIPIQDLMYQGTKYRMNTPGTRDGNWHYRMSYSDYKELNSKKEIIKEMILESKRINHENKNHR